MLLRSIPLAVCLLWLAYESHFSPSFFVATLETGFESLAGGLDSIAGADIPGNVRTASAGTDALQ